MQAITELTRKLRTHYSKKGVEDRLFSILRQNQHIIKQYFVNQIFVENISGEGVSFGYYKKQTAEFNASKKRGSPFTLIDTGLFFNSYTVQVIGKSVQVFADSGRTAQMNSNPSFDSTEFFTLTEENEIAMLQGVTRILNWELKNAIK